MQNLALLAAGYVFYGWWDWRFLALLFSISLLNYLIGRGIESNTKAPARKAFLGLGLLLNIGTLFYFKYFNFFINEIAARCAWLGIHVSNPVAKIILPVGISFYTFLSISYIIDIYQRKLKSPDNVIDTLLALSFFPMVLAGPLERPRTLLPQIQKIRVFDSALATDGMRQILWGLFAKVVIADNCAVIVNDVFKNYQNYSGSTLLFRGDIVHHSDICRFLRVFQHRHRGGQAVRVRHHAELQLSLFRHQYRRVLEAVEHLADPVVPGLCISADRLQGGREDRFRQIPFHQCQFVHLYSWHFNNLAIDRAVAWGKLHFYPVGRHSWGRFDHLPRLT